MGGFPETEAMPRRLPSQRTRLASIARCPFACYPPAVKPQPPAALPPVRSGNRTIRRRRHRVPRHDQPWWTDVRKFFGVSLFTYAIYDAMLRPMLQWLAGLLSH